MGYFCALKLIRCKEEEDFEEKEKDWPKKLGEKSNRVLFLQFIE